MEKLKLEHIAPYLPYGLKWSLNELMSYTMSGITKETLYTTGGAVLNWPKHDNLPQVLFPILRPLSDLTKDIEVDGKKFSPLLKLADKLFNKEPDSFDSMSSAILWVDQMIINQVIENKGYDNILHWAFQDLIKWHFDVFSLIEKGLAIDINTLK